MVRLVGINHVALEVGDVEEALAFYGRIFEIGEPFREPGMAFIAMGDQFLALSETAERAPEGDRHFGLVVDDREATRAAAEAAGVTIMPGRGLNVRDPWGNWLQIVDYRDIKLLKAPSVLRGMGLDGLEKRPAALDELRQNGLL
jgi:catechol 2,3-dioxygenase-like lactoylglutathione lyase family enzyme